MEKIRKFGIKIKKKYDRYPLIGSLLVFFIIFLSYGSIYFFNMGVLFIDDHFFHFKYAYLIRTEGWDVIRNFKWIYLTNTAQDNIPYSVTLYNLLLLPFTYLKDMILGMKIADVFLGSSSLGLTYYAFRKFNLRGSFFWTLLLVSGYFYMSRMLAGRAFVIIPALALLEIYLAVNKKKEKFFFLSLFHILWHPSSFFFPIVIACIVEAARVLDRQKIYWKNIFGGLLAFLLSIVFSSWSIIDQVKSVWNVQLGTKGVGLDIEGAELYTVDIFRMLGYSELYVLILFVCFAITFWYYFSNRKKIGPETHIDEKEEGTVLYSSFLFSLLAFSGTVLVSGRFFDFYFVAVVFFIAIAAEKVIVVKLSDIPVSLKTYLSYGLIIFFMIAVLNTFLNRKQAIAQGDFHPTGEVAQWVAEKSQDGDKVFLSNWGFFPVSFFFDSKNIYSMGIEPRALLEYDPVLYWKWYNMTQYGIFCERAENCKDEKDKFADYFSAADEGQREKMNKDNSRKIIEAIKNDFGANHVICSSEFGDILMMNPELISDSIEKISEISGRSVRGFQLK